MGLIDSLAYASRLRKIHPGKKMLAAGIGLLLALFVPGAGCGGVLALGFGVVTVAAGKTPVRLYLRLLRLPAAFIGMSLLAIVVHVSTEPAGAFLAVGPWYLSVLQEGPKQAAELAARAVGSVSVLYFLALSTPLTDFFYVLERMKCPALVMELMLLIYRFIFLLWSIAAGLFEAAESRMGNRTFSGAVRTAGQLFATLFVCAIRRAQALYDAMESRGYDGRIRVLPGFEPERGVRNGKKE